MNMIRYEQAGSVPASANHVVSLSALLDRAAAALVSAKSSAEVLEARDMARVAYDAAKSAGRLAKAKQAHDTVLAEVYRAQADALMIEARAKMRLAEEYDSAKDRGEVQQHGGQGKRDIPSQNIPSAKDIDPALPKLAHEGRQLISAEAAEPGIAQRAIDAMLDRGEEPTKAKLNREILNRPKPAPQKVMDQTALWVWGRLKDFERDGVLSEDPAFLISEMTDPMREDLRRISPLVRAFLENMEQSA